jgi:hypothetical protein
MDFLAALGRESGADQALSEPAGELGLSQSGDNGGPRDPQGPNASAQRDTQGGPEDDRGTALPLTSAPATRTSTADIVGPPTTVTLTAASTTSIAPATATSTTTSAPATTTTSAVAANSAPTSGTSFDLLFGRIDAWQFKSTRGDALRWFLDDFRAAKDLLTL